LWNTGSPMALAWKLFTMLYSLCLADMVTGVLHIYLDHRRCDLNDPLDMAAYSFRYDHHAFPLNFLKDSPFLPAGASEIVTSGTLPITAVTHLVLFYYGYTANMGMDTSLELKMLIMFTVIIGGTACQTTHALAHEGRSMRNKMFPQTIALLQRLHIILPPHVHGQHHQDEHDKNFCILNGWANPLLNRLVPYIFMAMRKAPGHFDALAVPGPNSWASQQKRKEAAKLD